MVSWGNCRYYENKLPELDQVVMVNIKQVRFFFFSPLLLPTDQKKKLIADVTKTTEMGVYVKLLEYDNIDGMILFSELSRRRIRSMQKLVRIGNNEVVVVIRVDKDKGASVLSSPSSS